MGTIGKEKAWKAARGFSRRKDPAFCIFRLAKKPFPLPRQLFHLFIWPQSGRLSSSCTPNGRFCATCRSFPAVRCPLPPGLKKQLVGFPAVKRSSCICQTKPTFFRWTSSRLRAKWSTRRDPHAKRLNMRRGSAAVFSHWENLLYISACNPVSQFCAMGSANG